MALNGDYVKNVVRNNFKVSIDKYFEFENKYNFFYNLSISLGDFTGINENDNVLDVGCGYGVSTEALKNRFNCKIKGIDISEHMINFGRKLYKNIELFVGDGEKLENIFNGDFFDKILYNASIFIFPDTFSSFLSAKNILKHNGIIGFSHYPLLFDENGEDLMDKAYKLANFEKPKRNVISSLKLCIENLKKAGFKNIEQKEYILEFEKNFIEEFFLIPAQSASLFPKEKYENRKNFIKKLFESIKKFKGFIKWPLVKATR